MNILLIGQTTLHWGRMEYGNIGNYYIIEPFVRELHRIFPKATIKTTLQMTDDFCQKEKIIRLPMELYYSWNNEKYFDTCVNELGIATLYKNTGKLVSTTPYIKEVLDTDLVMDFSGDIWGDNADIIGKNRFLIGLIKDRVAQLLSKKTVMIAGSPGPFKNHNNNFTKTVFKNFDFVTNREEVSSELLKNYKFNTKKVVNLACPAFLFEPEKEEKMLDIYQRNRLDDNTTQKIGFIVCGWNLKEGPYDKNQVADEELINFVKAIEFILEKDNTKVFLMSHSNGFELPPNFKLIQGRDFLYAKQLFEILKKRGITDMEKIELLDGLYSPRETKAIIGKFDMLVSGRIHGAVAALSQNIPTVIMDYGHEPKAHKLRGFARVAGVEEYLTDPSDFQNMIDTINKCWENKKKIKHDLEKQIPKVKNDAKKNFELLLNLWKKNNIIYYKTNTTTKNEIITHLQSCNNNFEPPLETYINIKEYGEKLHKNAVNFEAWSEDNLVGLISVYFNNQKTKISFISNVSVNKDLQKQGIANHLLENAIQYGITQKFKSIELEVNNKNNSAIKLYRKKGFEVKNLKDDKIMLNKTLK